jgi:hypothetical protein
MADNKKIIGQIIAFWLVLLSNTTFAYTAFVLEQPSRASQGIFLAMQPYWLVGVVLIILVSERRVTLTKGWFYILVPQGMISAILFGIYVKTPLLYITLFAFEAFVSLIIVYFFMSGRSSYGEIL